MGQVKVVIGSNAPSNQGVFPYAKADVDLKGDLWLQILTTTKPHTNCSKSDCLYLKNEPFEV